VVIDIETENITERKGGSEVDRNIEKDLCQSNRQVGQVQEGVDMDRTTRVKPQVELVF
jgi:hypothetical protein